MRFILYVVVASILGSSGARADVTSSSGENLMIKVTMNDKKDSSKFEVCTANGETCRLLGNTEWYSHKTLRGSRMWAGVAAGWYGMQAGACMYILTHPDLISGQMKGPMYLMMGFCSAVMPYMSHSHVTMVSSLRKALIQDKDFKSKNVRRLTLGLHRGLTGVWAIRSENVPYPVDGNH